MISEKLKYQLIELASQYETPEFLQNDPAQFMHRFSSERDIEIVALISASLALGQRPVILSKMERICKLMQGKPSDWIERQKYIKTFPEIDRKFYRFFSYAQMRHFFCGIRTLIMNNNTIGDFVRQEYVYGVSPLNALIGFFNKGEDIGQLIPKDTHSCCKRLNMYLRWMVRDNSPVDMGLWTWYDKSKLIIPADTHVMHEALELGIINKGGCSMAKACEITDAMKQVWASDPCRGDFALFGLGINL